MGDLEYHDIRLDFKFVQGVLFQVMSKEVYRYVNGFLWSVCANTIPVKLMVTGRKVVRSAIASDHCKAV